MYLGGGLLPTDVVGVLQKNLECKSLHMLVYVVQKFTGYISFARHTLHPSANARARALKYGVLSPAILTASR